MQYFSAFLLHFAIICANMEQSVRVKRGYRTADMETFAEYFITEDTVHIEDHGAVSVYGIGIETTSGKAVVGGISTNRPAVEALCEKLRRGQISPLHLRDVAEDFLCE